MSLLFKTSRFLNDAAGIEKSLRFIQALTQLISCNTPTPAPWLIARKQIALGRRYFRIPKIVPAFSNSIAAFTAPNPANERLLVWLDSTRWTCQGMYLVTETCTMLDAMGITDHEWAGWMTLEANKFWFYALFLGAVIGILQLASLSPPSLIPSEDEKQTEEKKTQLIVLEKACQVKRTRIMRQLVVDTCDLFIPGGVLGWYVVSCNNLCIFMLTSTVLAGVDIWDRVNRTG